MAEPDGATTWEHSLASIRSSEDSEGFFAKCTYHEGCVTLKDPWCGLSWNLKVQGYTFVEKSSRYETAAAARLLDFKIL